MEESFKVEKLTGPNYHSWKFSMKMLLVGKDLWDVLNGSEVLEPDASDVERKKFRKRENYALSIICLAVNTSLHIYIRSAKTPQEAWRNLADRFEEKSLARKIFYRRKLYSCRLERGQSMEDHVNDIKTISEHLESLDDPVQEKDLVMILISSLTDDYNNLITALESLKDTELTWSYVRERVISEFERKKGQSDVGKVKKDVDALFIENKGSKNKSYPQMKKQYGKKDISNFKCHFCHEKGHFQKDCPKKRATKNGESSNFCEGKGVEEAQYFSVEFALQVSENETGIGDWWLDSGCSQHMTCFKGDFVNYQKLEIPIDVHLADKSVVPAIGQGDVRIVIFDNDREIPVGFRNVLFVPKLKKRLLSISEMTKSGAEVKFKGNICSLYVNQKNYVIGHKHGKLWKMNNSETCCFGSTDMNSLTLWHQRFGHLNVNDLKKLSSDNIVEGLSIDAKALEEPCEGCILGKQARYPFPKKSQSKTHELLELIHSDVCGPMNVASVGGSLYFVTFTDDYSGYAKVFMLKNKSEVFEKFCDYVAFVENFTGKKVKRIRSDNGGEYTGVEFNDYCRKRGIVKEHTIPYTPAQNGVSERLNRTIMENVRAMLYQSALPLYLWAEAVHTVVYLRNLCPTSRFKGETPYERMHGIKPKVDHLRIFGSKAYVHIPDEKRRKLDPKSQVGIFVGYPEGSKGYKIFFPETRKFIRSRDVRFMENSKYGYCDDRKLEVNEDNVDDKELSASGKLEVIEDNVDDRELSASGKLEVVEDNVDDKELSASGKLEVIEDNVDDKELSDIENSCRSEKDSVEFRNTDDNCYRSRNPSSVLDRECCNADGHFCRKDQICDSLASDDMSDVDMNEEGIGSLQTSMRPREHH